MEKSVMGNMMGIEGSGLIKTILIWSFAGFPFAVVLSIIAGFLLRKRNSEDKNV